MTTRTGCRCVSVVEACRFALQRLVQFAAAKDSRLWRCRWRIQLDTLSTAAVAHNRRTHEPIYLCGVTGGALHLGGNSSHRLEKQIKLAAASLAAININWHARPLPLANTVHCPRSLPTVHCHSLCQPQPEKYPRRKPHSPQHQGCITNCTQRQTDPLWLAGK